MKWEQKKNQEKTQFASPTASLASLATQPRPAFGRPGRGLRWDNGIYSIVHFSKIFLILLIWWLQVQTLTKYLNFAKSSEYKAVANKWLFRQIFNTQSATVEYFVFQLK